MISNKLILTQCNFATEKVNPVNIIYLVINNRELFNKKNSTVMPKKLILLQPANQNLIKNVTTLRNMSNTCYTHVS